MEMALSRPTLVRTGIVLAGYAAAWGIATAAVAIRIAVTSGAADASGGMYAFGDAILFLCVFGGCAIIPTAVALWWSRKASGVWGGVSILALGIAVTGCAIGWSAPAIWGDQRGAAQLVVFVAIVQMFVAPVIALGFAVCAFLAPARGARFRLIAASALQLLAAMPVVVHLFGSRFTAAIFSP